MREINVEGLALLKKLEGCRLNAYQDVKGIWTVGYGHTGSDVFRGLSITQPQAEDLLKQDLQRFYHVDQYLSERVNDNQYAAIICFVYNIGLRPFKMSKTLTLVNDGECPDDEWIGFDHVDGVPNKGLRNRRLAELTLYHKLG